MDELFLAFIGLVGGTALVYLVLSISLLDTWIESAWILIIRINSWLIV